MVWKGIEEKFENNIDKEYYTLTGQMDIVSNVIKFFFGSKSDKDRKQIEPYVRKIQEICNACDRCRSAVHAFFETSLSHRSAYILFYLQRGITFWITVWLQCWMSRTSMS